jgi:protein-tyrosine phosphatase
MKFGKGSHIIFLCQGNIHRSPLAEAMFKARMKALDIDCKIESAGVLDLGFSTGAAPEWRDFGPAQQYDLSKHRSRYIMSVPYTDKTFFACVDEGVAADIRRASKVSLDRVFLLNPPHGVDGPRLSSYQDCFVQIHTGIAKLMEKLGLNR